MAGSVSDIGCVRSLLDAYPILDVCPLTPRGLGRNRQPDPPPCPKSVPSIPVKPDPLKGRPSSIST